MFLISKKKLILASSSPRRRELLQNVIKNLIVIPSSFDETSIRKVEARTYVKKLSLCKARAVANYYPNNYVIGADTIVSIEDSIIEKPNNKNDARNMLKLLSGKTHKVYTGYTIICFKENSRLTSVISTDVKFKVLTKNEINSYVETGESFDKSGGYAIQGIGSFMIKKINGSFTNVMGLPLCEILENLYKMKVIEFKS